MSLIQQNTTLPYPLINIQHAIDNQAPTLDFVLPGLVVGTVGSIVAPGATGKSWFALQLAAIVGTGIDTMSLGFDGLKTGRVLLLAAEDPQEVLWARLRALSGRLAPEHRINLIKNVDIAPCVGKSGDLSDDGLTANQIIQCGKYRLIIIDTLSRWHSGDENSRKDAVLVMRNLEKVAIQTGAAIIFLHHTSKFAAINGQGAEQQASRGSGVWVDEARWVAYLKVATEVDAKLIDVSDNELKKYVKFGVSKANYCPPQAEVWLKRGFEGMLESVEIPTITASLKYGEGKKRGYTTNDF